MLKRLSMISLLAVTTMAFAQQPSPLLPNPDRTVHGKVMEVKEVASYTYLLLKTGDGETWAAINRTPVKKGDDITIENVTVMSNFTSKTLHKTFPKILFGTVGGEVLNPHALAEGRPAQIPSMDMGNIHVAKARDKDARTVEEIITNRAKLGGKTVVVRGKVVKYNPQIMGKNWVHIRDGSGSEAKETDDLLVTTQDQTKVGDVITARGTVRTDKDFGAGYYYKVMIESARLKTD